MDPRELFDANLPLIDRISRRVCAKGGLMGADAEDFASEARLQLLDNGCAILRQWEGRAALATFLTIIMQRMLADWRRQATGKWRPSAEARRMGDAAVMLERLVRRYGRSLEEALPALRSVDPSLSADEARAIIERLPGRVPPPRVVALDPEIDIPSARDHADAGAALSEAQRLSERTSGIIRKTIDAMPLEDRLIVRFRFARGFTIATIARMLRLPQRPLYRRIESIVARLRAALLEAGIDASAVEELIGSPLNAMDFGLWKNEEPGPANHEESRPDQAGEWSP